MGGIETLTDTYEIQERLGAGGGGIVYKAYHKRLRKEVVLKQIRNKSISMSVNRQEVDILKNLNHSYLPQVFDFLDVDGEIYTVMSYIPGKSFQQLMKEGYHFSQNQLIRWGMQICSALNYLHSQKPPIIHGDIKPANIMLKPDGNICLIDFNVSFFLDENAILGYTDGYTSPEQYIIALSSQSAECLPQHSHIDEKTDIYSVGATFYNLTTGEKVKNYQKKIDYDLVVAKMSEAFAQVIQKATQIQPQERYQTAFEMFQAFQGIAKKDIRYQKLIKQQTGIRIGLVVAMGAFIILGGYGIYTLKTERLDHYNALVEQQIQQRENGEYKAAEATYEAAADVMDSGLENYYQNAYSLYQQGKYLSCIEFIDYDILQNEKLDMLQARMADIYYLKADSHFQLQEYETAVETYERVFEFGAQKSEYYRDYAIALAYTGAEKKADAVLQEAIDYGLKEDSIYYAKGEIQYALQNGPAALEQFQQCLNLTDNDQLKTRAYLMSSRIYKEKNDLFSGRQVLLEARQVLPEAQQMQVLESLAQMDIELAEKEGDKQFREEAIAVLQDVINQGWDTYETYDTLAILYQKQGNISAAENMVSSMLELYGEDYNIYKRYAFLEIDKQELKENESRDYTAFQEFYEKATQMYYAQLRDNNTDTEIQLLENVYAQVEEGGWF